MNAPQHETERVAPKTTGGPLWTLVVVGLVAATSTLLFWRFSRATDAQVPFFGSGEKEAAQQLVGNAIESFTLTSQEARPFGLTDLRGKIWVADFVFTHCAGPCPRMSSEMETLRGALAGVDGLHFVSFSVDPVRDTPQVLADYALAYGKEGKRWTLLTGDRATIVKLARDSFHVPVAEAQDPNDPNSILHSTRFFLVDREGRLSAYYDSRDPAQLARLLADTRKLAEAK